jgi:hypothetical protein
MLGPIDFVQLYKMYGPQNQPDATKVAKETEATDA